MRKLLIIGLIIFGQLFANEDVNITNNSQTSIIEENNDFQSYKIEVIVKKKIMTFYGIDDNRNIIPIKQFIVATPKTTIEYPKELGRVVKVDLDPWWYPTDKTIEEFKKHKNICLPSAVPPGDKQNYMGSFKIILSNSTKERGSVYRIHGNIDPKSIGKRSSGGCVRMHNEEGREFAILVKNILEQGKQVTMLYI
ncbi:MAG: L,D-transpeptidase YnhG [Patescibacteria group bacterium]|nr:L,D-transpeptidase YnhG [Patescibacteria group bacterium]